MFGHHSSSLPACSARSLSAARDCPLLAAEHRPRACEFYPVLLGYYLGDGHLARARSSHVLRISCDVAHPGVIDDVRHSIQAVNQNGSVCLLQRGNCTVVQSQWQHWPCLFPQHGPGPKHLREIQLADWQHDMVEAAPELFLRGLMHSDGSRVRNWATRPVRGEVKRYDYPRWQFVNASADIRELCCWALDLVDVAWRQSNVRVISVSRREAVARLDALIGPKT